jgi:hypothetical protein
MSSNATPLDALRVIARQAVGAAGAAVMAGDDKALEAERGDRLDLVEGQSALRMSRVAGTRGRLRTVAIAAQVGHGHSELGGETRRQLDFRTRRRDPERLEAGEEVGDLRSHLVQMEGRADFPRAFGL